MSLIPLLLLFFSVIGFLIRHHTNATGRLEQLLASNRANEMSGAATRWETTDRSQLNLIGSRIEVSRLGSFFGLVELDVNGEATQIFDWDLGADLAGGTHSVFSQTVISFAPQELPVPPFCLYPQPQHLVSRENYAQLRYQQPVESAAVHDMGFGLDSIQPMHVRELFNTETAAQELLPFVRDRNWTVEWTSRHLIVYCQNKSVDPDQLKYFAADALRLAELIRQADDEAELAISARIAASVGR